MPRTAAARTVESILAFDTVAALREAQRARRELAAALHIIQDLAAAADTGPGAPIPAPLAARASALAAQIAAA